MIVGISVSCVDEDDYTLSSFQTFYTLWTHTYFRAGWHQVGDMLVLVLLATNTCVGTLRTLKLIKEVHMLA